jgi:hypothetical protein
MGRIDRKSTFRLRSIGRFRRGDAGRGTRMLRTWSISKRNQAAWLALFLGRRIELCYVCFQLLCAADEVRQKLRADFGAARIFGSAPDRRLIKSGLSRGEIEAGAGLDVFGEVRGVPRHAGKPA